MSKALLIACLMLFQSMAWAGDRYRIDPEHTFSSFEYMHWGLSLQRGRFDSSAGTIELDREAKSISIDLEIDTASVNTGSGLFDRILRSDSFFDVTSYPKITFKSTDSQFDGDDLVQVDGDLTIKSISRPIKLEITHFACRFMLLYFTQACGASGSAKIRRSDFGLGRYAPFVSDDITLYFTIEGIRENTPQTGPNMSTEQMSPEQRRERD